MTMTSRTSPEQADLFCDTGNDRAVRTRNSMLWAAYGDALGFISELTDENGLKRRTQGAALDRLMPWSRRVGGRGGVNVLLPAGCWSDDTQLRMAVSRSITQHGFDVETFARFELPVWPSYALGGGRASKAAAKNLAANSTLWHANTFSGWHEAGGNGAAMRIQPHVWASPDLDTGFLLDVITDSICTHGHPRAIVGACFHASTLAHCLRKGVVPALDECAEIAIGLGDAASMIKGHQSLGTMWIGLWERAASKDFSDQWQTTVEELCDAIHQAATASNGRDSLADTYRTVCERLELNAEHQKGSGILTPVAAAALAATAPQPYEAMVVAANQLGTDTDTIATMAGALLGACHPDSQPPEDPLDSPYLLEEADRLTGISLGSPTDSHQYPDTLTWAAPQTQADALVTDDNQLAIEGLGPVKELGTGLSWSPRKDFAWQWVETEFGQTLLIKRRPDIPSRKAGNTLTPPPVPQSTARSRKTSKATRQMAYPTSDSPLDRSSSIEGAVKYAKKNISDNRALGRTVRQIAQEGTEGDLIAFISSIRNDLRC